MAFIQTLELMSNCKVYAIKSIKLDGIHFKVSAVLDVPNSNFRKIEELIVPLDALSNSVCADMLRLDYFDFTHIIAAVSTKPDRIHYKFNGENYGRPLRDILNAQSLEDYCITQSFNRSM